MKLLNKVLSLTAKRHIKTASELFIYHSDYSGAVDVVIKAIELEPTNAKARVLYADILFCLNREMESLAILDELIDEQDTIAEAYISRASIQDALGKHREALNDCSKALRLAANGKQYLFPSIYEQKISLLLSLKLHKACKQLLSDAALKLDTDDFDCLLNAYHNQLSKRRIKLKEDREIELSSVPNPASQHLRLVKA